MSHNTDNRMAGVDVTYSMLAGETCDDLPSESSEGQQSSSTTPDINYSPITDRIRCSTPRQCDNPRSGLPKSKRRRLAPSEQSEDSGISLEQNSTLEQNIEDDIEEQQDEDSDEDQASGQTIEETILSGRPFTEHQSRIFIEWFSCAVCLNTNGLNGTVFLPCGDLGVCLECFKKSQLPDKCPKCSKTVRAAVGYSLSPQPISSRIHSNGST